MSNVINVQLSVPFPEHQADEEDICRDIDYCGGYISSIEIEISKKTGKVEQTINARFDSTEDILIFERILNKHYVGVRIKEV